MAAHPRARTGALSLAALGVVYGDIGTSPLYAMRESLEGAGHELAVVPANVLGLLSLIFWSLVVVVTIKYLVFVLRADNDGEGGILALTSLLHVPPGSRRRRVSLLLLGLFGTALLYGDGMITPAISVLSAVEGAEVVAPSVDRWVIPAAVVILIGLFSIQRHGTASIGKVFGPVMTVWFATLALLGVVHLVDEPSVLRALSPTYAIDFFADNGMTGFLALGSVFLVVTGGEALYADMGHFGTRPIRLGWFGLVLPSLVLHYFGQGALLIGEPDAIENPFYRMVPDALVLPLVVLATLATVIASQALISGAFSLTLQAVQLGYAPRIAIHHTSETEIGQIYVPAINRALMIACVGLVVGFQSSSALAAAYGVAVTLTMVITTVLFYVVARDHFRWRRRSMLLLCGAFLVVDVAFFGANINKIPHGGWFPLVMGAAVFTLLTTWRTGRRILGERITGAQLPLEDFFAHLFDDHGPARVPGTAVFLFSVPGMTPPALVTNVRHNRVLHERVVIVAIATADQPHVLPARRSEVTDIGHGVFSVLLRYGFLDEPDVPTGLREGAASKLVLEDEHTHYFLGAESLVVTKRPGMAMWRERLFAVMSRNATPAADHFNLPSARVTTLGSKIEL